jgi:hypothetical protein
MGLRLMLLLCAALAMACGAMGGGSTGDKPIVGKKRGELCESVKQPPAFACPAGTKRRGKPPPDGTEMWCQSKEGARNGPYRRFPPSAAGVSEPTFVADGVVVGEYKDDRQHGAWWTPRPGTTDVSVQYFEAGQVAQKITCRR